MKEYTKDERKLGHEVREENERSKECGINKYMEGKESRKYKKWKGCGRGRGKGKR